MKPEIAAEAAVWVARLHGPGRSARMEQEFLQWQSRSAEHRLAFERFTDTWELVGGLTLSEYARAALRSEVVRDHAPVPTLNRRAWTLAATGALALICGAYPRADLDLIETGVGERRTVVLRDGSRLSLNTGSRVRVRFLPERRVVDLVTGEALFEVAKDPRRPFIVLADGVQVRATGTTFLVRSLRPGVGSTHMSEVRASVSLTGSATSAGRVSVTLIEGQVVVGKRPGKGEGDGEGITADAGSGNPVVLVPGERLFIASPKSLKGLAGSVEVVARDRPRLDQVVAWQRGEAVFQDALLLDAVAEMNRYSATPIVAEEGALELLRVSGAFRTGDNAGFARALAKLHGLRIDERVDRIDLFR